MFIIFEKLYVRRQQSNNAFQSCSSSCLVRKNKTPFLIFCGNRVCSILVYDKLAPIESIEKEEERKGEDETVV